jgi:hypothetical protein
MNGCHKCPRTQWNKHAKEAVSRDAKMRLLKFAYISHRQNIRAAVGDNAPFPTGCATARSLRLNMRDVHRMPAKMTAAQPERALSRRAKYHQRRRGCRQPGILCPASINPHGGDAFGHFQHRPILHSDSHLRNGHSRIVVLPLRAPWPMARSGRSAAVVGRDMMHFPVCDTTANHHIFAATRPGFSRSPRAKQRHPRKHRAE